MAGIAELQQLAQTIGLTHIASGKVEWETKPYPIQTTLNLK